MSLLPFLLCSVSIIPPSFLSFCHLHLSILLTPLYSSPLCFPLVAAIIHKFSFLCILQVWCFVKHLNSFGKMWQAGCVFVCVRFTTTPQLLLLYLVEFYKRLICHILRLTYTAHCIPYTVLDSVSFVISSVCVSVHI